MFGFLKRRKIPTINLTTETREVKTEPQSFKVDLAKSYVPPTDKEILEALEFQDNYEAAYLITSLKKENAVLKRKLTILQKEYEKTL